MATSETVDLLSFGEHCKFSECNRLDFLPISCAFCSNKFCSEHFTPTRHTCPQFIDKDSWLPQCPLCHKYVTKGINGDDDNKQIERHILSNCKAFVLERRKKNRCGETGCKMHSPVPFYCGTCYRSFCVRHRHSEDHNCACASRNLLIAAR